MKQSTGGFALIIALSLVVVLAIVLVTYSTLTVGNARTAASSGNSSAGFYAAEGAMNARAEQVRQKFKGFQVPSGTSPSTTRPCQGSNVGSGDVACQSAVLGGRTVTSYAQLGSTRSIIIPQGQNFEFLSAQENPVTVYGQAMGASGNPEAITSLVFRSRLVPLFQFAVFFDKDLEFTNTASLTMTGPVHTNGNLFLDAGGSSTLGIHGQTTAAGTIYRGWKHDSQCSGTVTVEDMGGTSRTVPCSGARVQMTPAQMQATWGSKLKILPRLDVPSIDDVQPSSSAQYWAQADARIVLKLMTGSSTSGTATWTPLFVRADGTQLPVTCPAAAVSTSNTMRDNREASYWENPAAGNVPARANRRMLEVNMPPLLACLHANRTALGLGTPGIADVTQGGLVLYMTVDDTSGGGALTTVLAGGSVSGSVSQGSGRTNNYAVRLSDTNAVTPSLNGQLRSTVSTDPIPAGVTVVSDQAVFVKGDFNVPTTRSAGWVPASIIADSVNVLSKGWDDLQTCQLRVGSRTYWMGTTRYVWYKGNLRTFDSLSAGQQWNSTAAATTINESVAAVDFNVASAMNGTQQWYAYDTANFTSSAVSAVSAQGDAKSTLPLWCRSAQPTTVRAAVVAGTAITGNEGSVYSDPSMTQSGGVHNMMRFHEEWGGNGYNPGNKINYTYSGSLVSLYAPMHAAGKFEIGKSTYYNPPNRLWSFETQFQNAANLPPLTPRFVYLQQDNFTRQFEQP